MTLVLKLDLEIKFPCHGIQIADIDRQTDRAETLTSRGGKNLSTSDMFHNHYITLTVYDPCCLRR